MGAVNIVGAETSITIEASASNVVTAGGGLDNYIFDYSDPSGGSASTSLVALDADVDITGLTAGTAYTLAFKGYIAGCSGVNSSSETNVTMACTSELSLS